MGLDVSEGVSDSAAPHPGSFYTPHPALTGQVLEALTGASRERSWGGKSLEEEGMAEGLQEQFGEAQGVRVRSPN